MAGVMVVYHPPITHLPPPAVGASPDAAIYDFKGSCDAHHSARGREGRFGVGQNSPCARFFALHASSYMLRTHGQRHDSQK